MPQQCFCSLGHYGCIRSIRRSCQSCKYICSRIQWFVLRHFRYGVYLCWRKRASQLRAVTMVGWIAFALGRQRAQRKCMCANQSFFIFPVERTERSARKKSTSLFSSYYFSNIQHGRSYLLLLENKFPNYLTTSIFRLREPKREQNEAPTICWIGALRINEWYALKNKPK